MAKNREVAQAWMAGHPASAGHLLTDGQTVYSYKMKIGETADDGSKLVLPFKGVSMTTSRHGSELLRAGGRMKDTVNG